MIGEKKLLICAVDDHDKIAETLGTAKNLLIFAEDLPPVREGVHGSPAGQLLQRKGSILLCGKIGTCLHSLLTDGSVLVIPGCSGSAADVVRQWEQGTLKPAKNCFCFENGRTCGSCPGTY